MLIKIFLITCLTFAIIYPLCFWISFNDPLKNNFHKFHIGLPNFVGGVAVVVLLFMNIPLVVKVAVLCWKASLLSVSSYSWKKDYPNPRLFVIPFLLGIFAFYIVQKEFIAPGLDILFFSLLGGFILCSSIFAMNLGHWYLNVHGLPIHHLKRTVYVFWFFLLVRLIGDLYFIVTDKIIIQGDILPMYTFIQRMDGFFLLVALFFGTLFPLMALYFVRGTLEVKSTQSATGILYVILIAVFIGDLTYKYYLIQYGIPL